MDKAVFFDIPCTKEFVREIWLHFQKPMVKTDRTRDLKKIGEIESVHEVVMKNMGELFLIEYIPFPNEPDEAPMI